MLLPKKELHWKLRVLSCHRKSTCGRASAVGHLALLDDQGEVQFLTGPHIRKAASMDVLELFFKVFLVTPSNWVEYQSRFRYEGCGDIGYTLNPKLYINNV